MTLSESVKRGRETDGLACPGYIVSVVWERFANGRQEFVVIEMV